MYPQIRISQRFFEIGKLFYVKINHTCTTCCRIHIEFSNHFDVLRHICVFLHSQFVLQDCDMNEPPRSSTEFISNILCEIGDDQQFFKTSCLFCGSLQLLSTCQHMDNTHAIGNKIVDYEKNYDSDICSKRWETW